MPSDYLKLMDPPHLRGATMLLALGGWMDGGLVSTGTVRHMMGHRTARQIGRIDPDPFYIFNMPGSMEMAAVFRPPAKHLDGMIEGTVELPTNEFYCDAAANLVFFLGKEPHLRWQAFADGIFALAAAVGVARIIFIGSFGGAVPHTRQPRMYGSVSHSHLIPILQQHNVQLSAYEGPASFATLLLAQSPGHNIEMLSLVAEIPGYLEGLNPLSIEAVTRRLAHLLNAPADLDALRRASNAWEIRVSKAVEQDAELAATVRKLEEQYDNELISQSEAEPS